MGLMPYATEWSANKCNVAHGHVRRLRTFRSPASSDLNGISWLCPVLASLPRGGMSELGTLSPLVDSACSGSFSAGSHAAS